MEGLSNAIRLHPGLLFAAEQDPQTYEAGVKVN